MSPEVKKYNVSVFNQTYSLVSDEEESVIVDAANRVDSLMKEISSRGIDSKKAAVLAALKIAIDLSHACNHKMLCQQALNQLLCSIEEEICL